MAPLQGQNSFDYTFKWEVSIGTGVDEITDSVQFTVRVKNPCIDSSFLGITVADGIADKTYNVGDLTPVTEVHSAPVVTGSSVV